jgi:hypothetical protein
MGARTIPKPFLIKALALCFGAYAADFHELSSFQNETKPSNLSEVSIR